VRQLKPDEQMQRPLIRSTHQPGVPHGCMMQSWGRLEQSNGAHGLQGSPGDPCAQAGVLTLVNTGAVQAMAAPAPIRLSIFLRENPSELIQGSLLQGTRAGKGQSNDAKEARVRNN
jgi:hypothetical protein